MKNTTLIFEEQHPDISTPIQPLWKPLTKSVGKLLFKPMNAQELQNPEKVSMIWVKNLNKIVNKINNTELLMIGMKNRMQLN